MSKGVFDENKLSMNLSAKIIKQGKAYWYKSNPCSCSFKLKKYKIAQRDYVGTHQQESIEYGNVVHEILSL
jgi:hypothetical protein